MADNLSPQDRHKTMQAVKGKGTRLERRFFSMLAGRGIKGWKKNVSNIEGKPDVSFLLPKVAIFIDGCFWHGCPICKRKLPKENVEYWKRKINRNIELATIHNEKLIKEGWIVFRIWEHDIKNKVEMKKIMDNIIRSISKE